MTLKYMQGFETCRDDSDIRTMGWYPSGSAKYLAFTPSFTGLSGYSAQLIGAGASATTTIGTASASDPGYYNTGVTVNQAWQAGGFAFGCNARFNQATAYTYAYAIGTNGAASRNACYDPVNKLYWVVQYNGSAYALASSPDAINWTVVSTPALPTNTSGVSYMGGGIVAFAIATSQTAVQIYWTSNNGINWNLQALGTNSAASAVNMIGFATGNSAYPHAIYTQTLASGNQKMWIGTLGGTFTNVVSASVANSTSIAGFANVGGVALISDGNTASFNCAWSATLSNGSLNSAGAWNAITWSTYPGAVTDFAYNPVSNVYVLCSSTGIWTFANPGAAGTPTQLSAGAQTVTQRLSGIAMYHVFWDVPTQRMIAYGANGNIYTSPDCFTWTSQGQHINPVVANYGNLYNAVYDGSRYVLFDGTNGVISTTPDGVSNYSALYVKDTAEAAAGSYGILGVFSASTNFTTNVFSTVAWVGLAPAAISVGNRTITYYQGTTSTGTTVVPVNTGVLNHYYEIVGTAVPGTTNAFTITVYIDGQAVITSASAYQMGSSTSDTTSILGLQFGRNGAFVAWDDMYFCTNDGVGVSGPQGPINIIARRPTTDVQANWVKNGSAASNSLSVNQPALSSQSTNYVSSSVAGDKDLYASSTAIPSNYRPLAVQVEACTYKTSTTTPSINIGLKSGSTESDSPTLSVTSTSPTFMSQVYQNDPNGNVAWTSTSVQNAEFVVNHIS